MSIEFGSLGNVLESEAIIGKQYIKRIVGTIEKEKVIIGTLTKVKVIRGVLER